MLHVIWNAGEKERRNKEGRSSYAFYLFEILDDLGVSYMSWDHADWINIRPAGTAIVIDGCDHELWSSACEAYVESGNSLLTIGETYGLERLLGVRTTGRVHEGWIEWGDAPVAEGLRSAFHFFGARLLEGVDANGQQYGTLVRRNGARTASPALTMLRRGSGLAAMLNFDLMKTVCLIQQGVPVIVDGAPAPDGSGGVDEGYLKTDDGSVLDWERDRDAVEQTPFYLHPIGDEMRWVLNRLLVNLTRSAGCRLVQKWFWPGGLDGIGHISHDTDGNDAKLAGEMLDWLGLAGVRSTWCIIMPGYEQDINERIVNEGHEVALHYNAMEEEIAESRWSEAHFRTQLGMLQAQFPGRAIVSNKNHYLRWEGDVQFYHWCERAGIKVEQSKGGTKRGNKGFLAGTCHPYVPMGGASDGNRSFDLISLPTLAWDPPDEERCTEREAFALLERSRDVYGVAHFLLHPGAMGTMQEGAMGEVLVKLAAHGRSLGMEWWTSEEIWRWRRARNETRIKVFKESEDALTLSISAEAAVRGFTVLVAVRQAEELTVRQSRGCAVNTIRRVSRFGCDYMEVDLDAEPGLGELVFAKPEPN